MPKSGAYSMASRAARRRRGRGFRRAPRAAGARSSPPAACPSTRTRRRPRRRRAGTQRLAAVPAIRCVTLAPSVASARLQRARRQLLDHHALAGAHGDVAQHLARHVAEQAVQHVRAGELRAAAVQREDVGDHLPLDLPDEVEVGQDRQQAERAGRQRQRAGDQRRLLRRVAGDLLGRAGGVAHRVRARRAESRRSRAR